jgi:hypothetical protein
MHKAQRGHKLSVVRKVVTPFNFVTPPSFSVTPPSCKPIQCNGILWRVLQHLINIGPFFRNGLGFWEDTLLRGFNFLVRGGVRYEVIELRGETESINSSCHDCSWRNLGSVLLVRIGEWRVRVGLSRRKLSRLQLIPSCPPVPFLPLIPENHRLQTALPVDRYCYKIPVRINHAPKCPCTGRAAVRSIRK